MTHYGMQTWSPYVDNINNEEIYKIYKNQGIKTQFL